MTSFLLPLLCIGLTLFSCTGLQSNNRQLQLVPIDVSSKPNRNFNQNLSPKDLDYSISNRDYNRAAVVLSQLDNQGSINKTDSRKYLKLIQEGLGDLFLETADKKGVYDALPYYYSLKSLGIAQNFITESDFAERLFDFYTTKEYLGAALDFARSSIDNHLNLDPLLENKFQNFIEAQYAANSNDSDFWKHRIAGTVTILVKKGTERIPNTQLYLPSTEIGSGFFIDNSGSIITNYHVISSQVENPKAGQIFVKFASRDEQIPAKLIGWDTGRDLALLRTSHKTPYLLHMTSTYNLLTHNTIPNKGLLVGNELFAIGAPGGLESTLTSGLVSARRTNIMPLTQVVQIDVAANPGNSGGPLLNKQGIVEGVVFAKNNSGYEGIAFAIPSDTLSSVIPRLYSGGKVHNSWLGILVDERSNSQNYLEIRYIFPNSPAANSPLKPGQRILSYRNVAYNKIKALQNQTSNGPIGSIVVLRVLDPETEQEHDVVLELAERPDKPMYKNLGQESSSGLFYSLFGARLTPDPQKRNTFKVTSVLPYSQVSQLNLSKEDQIKILQWLIDSKKNVIIAHISYTHNDRLDQGSKQSVLIQQIDLPNII